MLSLSRFCQEGNLLRFIRMSFDDSGKKENGLNLFLGKISALNPKDIFNIWLNVEKLRLDFDILNIVFI